VAVLKVKLQKRAFSMPCMTVPESTKSIEKLVEMFPYGKLSFVPSSKDFLEPPEIDYTAYKTDEVDLLRADLLRVNFLKKAKFLSGTSPKEVAKREFIRAEEKCLETNYFLKKLADGRINDNPLNAVLFTAQRKIASILGRYSFESSLTLSRWGPGSTSSCKGAEVSASDKFAARPHTTPHFSRIAHQMLSECPSWSAMLADCDVEVPVSPVLDVIKGSRVSFVPKSAKTHRAICVEPHLNVYFQAGIGRLIRRKLKYAGVDLDDQSLNQRLAQYGSIDDSLATLDLRSASDTISHELVAQLLPEEWYEAMNACRSHYGSFDGKEYFRFNKFSSMGNGFTFDLESLIFYALALAVCELEGFNPFWVNVFGDDLVVPSGISQSMIDILEKCGFEVSKNKSFVQGPFRESCGHDYFLGSQVRSVYLKDRPVTPLDWLKIANSIRRLSHQWLEYKGCDRRLKLAYDFAVSRVPKDFRFKIPDGFGDGGLVVNFDEACPRLAADIQEYAGWEGFVFQHLTTEAVCKEEQSRRLITAGCHTLSKTGNSIPLRDKVVLKKATSIAPIWRDLGLWN